MVPDETGAHEHALAKGLEADVLVTSGGVSVGPRDLVRETAARLGVEEVFWGSRGEAGKAGLVRRPWEHSRVRPAGNPVSSLVGALLFVRPALLALQGLVDPRPELEVGRSGSPLRRSPGRDEFVRARRRVDADGVVLEPVSGQESHMIVRAATADALVHVPRGTGEIQAGAAVRYLALA